MIRNSVVAKLWLTIVGMVFLVLAILSVLLQQFFNKYVVQRETEQLTQLATSIQQVVASTDHLTTAATIANQLAKHVQQAQVDYTTSMTSHSSLTSTYQHFTTAQKRAFAEGQPVSIHMKSDNTEELAVYVQIHPKQHPVGILSVTQTMSSLDEPANQMRNLIFFDTILGIVLATGLAFVVSKNLSRPLIEMNRAAEEMARGHYVQRVDVVTSDEVGRLGNTFNALATELANTIEQLSMEREGLRRILSSLQDGVVATDVDGRVTLANPPALRQLRTLSVAEQGVVDMTFLPSRLMTLFSQVTDLREPAVREVTWEGRTITITMLPLYEMDGVQLRGVLGVLRDITEERRLDRLRKDFIANVSHELRTPLSMMQGYTEALLDDISEDPDMRIELTEIIHDEALRMKRLVNDLLNLAQLESGQFQMSMEMIDFAVIMKRIGRKFSALAQEYGVAFHLRLPTTELWMKADADRMEQVFTNLLDNAFRHTPSGDIAFEAEVRDHYAYIRVADTGAGIPEEDLPFIFERFYKADKARTRSRSGTGLGLSIARHIVFEHNGDILVDSVIGKGTTFTVVLPISVRE